MQMRYASGLVMNFCNSGNPEQGCRFLGDKGWVHVNRGGVKASDPKLLQIGLKDSDTCMSARLGAILHVAYGRFLPLLRTERPRYARWSKGITRPRSATCPTSVCAWDEN